MSPNYYTVRLTDGREVCYSYGVPVAARVPSIGYVKTDKHYSTTTSTHANRFCGKVRNEVADTVFVELISPLEAVGR